MRMAVLVLLTVAAVTGNQALHAQVPAQIAWDILGKGHTSHNAKERINAVRALWQLPGNPRQLNWRRRVLRTGSLMYVAQRHWLWDNSTLRAPFHC